MLRCVRKSRIQASPLTAAFRFRQKRPSGTLRELPEACRLLEPRTFANRVDLMIDEVSDRSSTQPSSSETPVKTPAQPQSPPREIGGRDGPEPTRFGDWEKAGRCI